MKYQFTLRDTMTAIIDEYARRHKPASGQLGLFEKPEERQKPLFSKKVDDESGRWVTMRGARVFISGEDGRIMKGPKALMGKTKEQIERESAGKEGAGDKAPKPKPLAEMGRISGGRADNRQKKLFEELNPGFQFEDDEDEDFKTVGPAVPVAEDPSSPAEDEPDDSFEQQVLNGIKEKLESGDTVTLVTNTKATQFDRRHVDMFRVKNGSLQVQRGKNWDNIAFGPLDHLASQVGVDRPETDFVASEEEEDVLSADFVNDHFNGDAGAAIEAMELNRKKEISRANELGVDWNAAEIDTDWMAGVMAATEESGGDQEDSEPTFTLDSSPQPQPSPVKPEDFGKSDSTKQGALFDTGKGDLPGQELLFNSDAGDLNNPKTMENRVNPFREKMDSLNRKADSLTPGNSAFDKSMASAFPVGVGRSGNASSRRTSKQAAKRIDSSINNALKSIEVRKQANSLQGQADAFDRGEIDQHGGRTELGKQKDAEQLAKSQEKKQSVQNFWDSHADYLKATLKPGDSLALAENPSNSVTVKRVNKTGITSEGGSKWMYQDLVPLKDGKPMTPKEVISAVNDWKKGQETPSSPAENSPQESYTSVKKKREAEYRKMKKEASQKADSEDNAMREAGKTRTGQEFINAELAMGKGGKMPHQMTVEEVAAANGTTAEKMRSATDSDGRDFELMRDHQRSIETAKRLGMKTAEEEGPNDGDTNAEGLVFRDGRWHRDEDEQPAPEASSSPSDSEPEQQSKPEPQSEPEKSNSDFSGPFNPETHGDYRSLMQLSRKIDSGELPFEDFQQAHKFYTDNKEAFVADLGKRYDAKQLRNMAANLGDWRAIRGESKKGENAESVYAAMMSRAFNVGDGISNIYSDSDIRGAGGMNGAAVRRLAAHVAKQTPESLAAHVEKEAKNIADWKAANEANEEAAANPKTLKDFELAIKKAGSYEKLTPEQQETYDNLMSEKTRSGREEVKKPTAVQVNVSGDHGGFELTKNFHSKRGQDIFTASPKNRVERDEYDKMNTAAKRLGGWYYKQFGGTPGGFHFPDEDKRNRFLQAMAGEKVDRSDILGAKQEEREKTVGEKLADHAERLEERAAASYSAERKENTNRRAGMAASARASAEADLNQAVRLRSISEAMANGEVKHLRGLNALTQLESLQRVWRQAQRQHEEQKLKEKYGEKWQKNATYQERENTYQASVNADSVSHAKIPRQIIYPANVSRFLEQAASTPGLKQEAAKWQKLFKRHTSDDNEKLTLSKNSSKEWFDFANRAKSKGVKHDWGGFGEKDDFQRLYAMGIQEDHELRAALRELAPHQAKRHGSVQKDPVKELEKKIHREHREQGFYPTPPRVIDRLMEHADIRDGQSVLEPSAGSGRIMDAVKAAHGDSVSLKGIEHHSSLQDLLKMKGHDVDHSDFLEHKGEYDRIVMNPPFENDQAIDHVRHAFSLLKPGGKLVAVVPGGDRLYRDGSRKKRKEFSDFVDEHGEFEELPESSFAGSDAPRQTGVNTSLVILKKPGESSVEKYSRLQVYETMNGVIDRYVRPEVQEVQVDRYAHPLVQAAVGAGAHLAINSLFKGQMRSVMNMALGAAMAAWVASSAPQTQAGQSAPSVPAIQQSVPMTPGQKQAAGNNAVNQIVARAMAQHNQNAQAAANAPPSPTQQAAHSISAAAAGKAGVPGVRPLSGGNATGVPGRVQVVNPASPANQPQQTQSAGKEGASAGKLPVTEPAGGGNFSNSDQPRQPAGASESKGGQFAPKGGAESGSSSGEFAPEASSSPADGDSGEFDVWHSPKTSPDQGYSGAASAGLGDAFATDNHDYAAQYGTPEKHTATMKNPYQMNAAEFRSFDRGPDASFAKSKAKRDELQGKGHDGIIVTHADGAKEHILFDKNNLKKQGESPRNYPDNLNKPASEQTDYSPPERSIDPPVRQSRKAAWEKTLRDMAELAVQKKEAEKAEKKQAKEMAKATSFNPAELEAESSQMIDDIGETPEAPKEDDFDSAKDYEKAVEKHNRSTGAKQATIKKRANASLIPDIAGEHDLDHSTLEQAVDDEIAMLRPYHNRKEEARQYISKMGWNARRINQAEDRGIDSSSTKFDDVASQWADMFPEIAGSDESEWVAKMWDLSREGAQDPPSASDEELVKRVAKRLAESGASSSPADSDSESDSDFEPYTYNPEDPESTPFSRSAVVGLIVDKYMRQFGLC